MLDVPQVFMILGQICAIAEVHEVKFVFTVRLLENLKNWMGVLILPWRVTFVLALGYDGRFEVNPPVGVSQVIHGKLYLNYSLRISVKHSTCTSIQNVILQCIT